MTVTGLEVVTKTKYKVFIDGQFAFVLYKGELSRFHLAEGQDVTPETVRKIRDEVVLKRAKPGPCICWKTCPGQNPSCGRN